MLHRLRAGVADLSRLLNLVSGGEPGKTLCWRVAMRFGPGCLFCRVVGFILREPHHCRDELTARDFIEWLKRR